MASINEKKIQEIANTLYDAVNNFRGESQLLTVAWDAAVALEFEIYESEEN